MADKEKRATSSTTGSEGKSVVGSKGKGFATKLNRLYRELAELSKDSEGLQEYEALLGLNTDLRKQLQSRHQEIKEKDAELLQVQKEREADRQHLAAAIDFKDSLFQEHEKRFGSWSAEKARYLEDLAGLVQLNKDFAMSQSTLKSCQKEKNVLREQLECCQGKLGKISQKHKKLEDEHRFVSLQLERTETKLRDSEAVATELRHNLGVFRPNWTEVIKQVKQLAEKMSGLVEEYFLGPIVDPVSSGVVQLPNGPSLIPLVPNNSPLAQSLRCAFSEAVIARELAEHVFVDFYGAQTFGGSLNGAINLLQWLNKNKPAEATVLRCQLAKACASTAETENLPARVADSICASLRPWLEDDSMRRRFELSLTELITEAMILWIPLQRSAEPVKATVTVTEREWPKRSHRFAQYETNNKAHWPAGPIAALFPQIYLISETKSLFKGDALLSTQGIVLAGHEEYNRVQTNRVANGLRRSSTQSGRELIDTSAGKAASNDVRGRKDVRENGAGSSLSSQG